MIPLIPFEQLPKINLPTSLDGSEGTNRSLQKPLINVNHDFEAIKAWLDEYAHRPATFRNYRKEAERLLLWSIIERKKPLSSLNDDDLLVYNHFVSDPQPREKWCGPKLARKGKRWSASWRPFVGPLGDESKETAFAGLTSLFNYLIEINYLAANPLSGVKRQVKKNNKIEEQSAKVAERILGPEEWCTYLDTLNSLPETTEEEVWEKIRLRFILALLYFAGLRIEELTSHLMTAFKKVRDVRADKDRWWLVITRKGGKQKKIPVNQFLLGVLILYRRYLKLPDFPEPNETEPLVRSSRTNKAISGRRINQIIRGIANEAASQFDSKQPEKAERLRKMSAHWLRHLSFSMQDLANMRKQHIKENAGHENDRTTEIYLHAIDEERHEEMEKLKW